MQPTPANWPGDSWVTEPIALVDVGDVNGPREDVSPETWNVDREIATYLPEQVRGISGQSVASANADIPSESSVSDTARNPFSRDSARIVETSCTIRAGFTGSDGRSSLVPVFTGRVMSADGAAIGDNLSLGCDDNAAKLRREVIVNPLATQMNYVPASGSPVMIFPGVSGSYVMDSVLRQLGYYNMPSSGNSTVVSLPLQGSLWPEQVPAGSAVSATSFYGTLSQARNASTEDNPTFVSRSWPNGDRFLALTGVFVLRVQPKTSIDTNWFRCSGWCDGGSGQTEIRVQSAGVPWTRIRIRPGEIEVAINTAGTPTHTFTGWPGGKFSIDVQGSGSTNTISLYYEGGSDSTILAGAHSNEVSYVQVISETGMALAGLQIRSSLSGSHSMIDFVSNSSIDPTVGAISATPGIIRAIGWDVMRQIAEAEMGAVWLDEIGTPTFRNRHSLRGIGETVHQITSRDDLLDLSWREATEQVRSKVRVPVLPVTSYLSDTFSNTVWSAADTDTVITVGARSTIDMVVRLSGMAIDIDTAPIVTVSNDRSRFHANTAPDGSGTEIIGPVTVTVVPSGPRVARIIVRNGYNARVWLVGTTGAPDLYIRARQKIIQAESATEYVEVENPGVDAETLDLDESIWIQDNSNARDLASFLAAELVQPRPVIPGVPVNWDPRRQLGDIVEVSDPDVTGMMPLRGVIVGIHQAGSSGSVEQSLSIRPLLPTVAEFNAAWSGRTVADVNTFWSGETVADLNANPLKVS